MNDADKLRIQRLETYENRTAILMVSLAVAYLVLFAVQVLVYPLPNSIAVLIDVISYLIWLCFAFDLIYRVYLAPNKWSYIARHPIDVIAVVVPAFRSLRILRVLTAGQWLIRRGKRLAIGQVSLAIAVVVVFLAFMGALAVLDAERGAENANITNFWDALWWAFVTMSTVGYGDVFPVTFTGRLVAVGMMVVGIGLLGVVSATLASGFVAALEGERETDTQKLLDKLDSLQRQVSKIDELQNEIAGLKASLDRESVKD